MTGRKHSKMLFQSFFLLFLLSVVYNCEARPVNLQSPVDYQVFQRFAKDRGTVLIAGNCGNMRAGIIEMRVGAIPAYRVWTPVHATISDSSFQCSVVLPAGGWYKLEIRVLDGKKTKAKFVIDHVGVGEVFVIAGQSNAANYGEKRQLVKSGHVSTYNGKGWQVANDPQPLADGDGGSFIPPFADAIASEFNIPVGIISCAIGATSVREWLPDDVVFHSPPTIVSRVNRTADGNWRSNGETYLRFVSLLSFAGNHGFRAVLWHQGESDANQQDTSRTLSGADYQAFLTQLIQRSRMDIGWSAPWFVAQASYHVPGDEGSDDIRSAQKVVADSGFALEGPDTDILKGSFRENNGKGVHFSDAGLQAHAAGWYRKLSPWLATELLDSTFEKQLPLPGETFRVNSSAAFVILPSKFSAATPWVWYAPTLPGLPGVEERWMFERFTRAGIAIAGIDAGESYGSPEGQDIFSALYMELTQRHGFSSKPMLLGRSRGGLQTLSWAAGNADKVSGFAGVYPVCNIASYPGIEKASPAYKLSPDDLTRRLSEYNPVDRLQALAAAQIPFFAIHGDVDVLVPLELNSGMLKKNYELLGGSMELVIPNGQGHSMWNGFFESLELVDFVIRNIK